MKNIIIEQEIQYYEPQVIDVKQVNITSNSLRDTMQGLLNAADVKINGSRPWDIQVNNDKFYRRVFCEGSLGLGESYMDGWWECEALDQLFFKTFRAEMEGRIQYAPAISFPLFYNVIKARVLNCQCKSRAFKVGEHHYDIGNDLYQVMLDKRMVYTCAYWKDARNLDEAQEAKLDLVCRKLKLRPGMHILDIGCGWGSFAKYAAEHYQVKVTGITVSRKQVELAQENCSELPIDIKLQDYRDLTEKFDHIVSLGMFEHVGHKNYRTYMEIVHQCLNDDGLFLLQTIGGQKSVTFFDSWLDKYIFPNAMIPSIKQIGTAIEGLFVEEDWENIDTYYDKTLIAWFQNFNNNWLKLRSNYNERFYRMWKYYLLSCAGLFRARKQQVWQIVLSKHGVLNGYES